MLRFPTSIHQAAMPKASTAPVYLNGRDACCEIKSQHASEQSLRWRQPGS